MTKNERLADLRATQRAVLSQRNALVESTNNRTRRNKRVRNAIAAARVARQNLDAALATIRELRDLGRTHDAIDALNRSLAERAREIRLVEAEAEVERLAELKRQIEAMELALGLGAEPEEEDIVS